MNKYISEVLETVRKKNASEREFMQTVEEDVKSIEPGVEEHP